MPFKPEQYLIGKVREKVLLSELGILENGSHKIRTDIPKAEGH